MPSTQESKPAGEILPGVLYHYPEACRRLRWSATAARSARRKGLSVRYVANRAYVSGDELIRFILETGKEAK